jgi:hypothetical protein
MLSLAGAAVLAALAAAVVMQGVVIQAAELTLGVAIVVARTRAVVMPAAMVDAAIMADTDAAMAATGVGFMVLIMATGSA